MTYHSFSSGDFLDCKKKSIIFFLLFGGVLICFCSCVSGTKAREDKPAAPYVWLTDSSKYILLPPEDIEHPLDGHQLVSASYLRPEYIVADFQLCFYKAPAVRQALEGNFE
jgi:hypothetical protein